MCFLHSEQNRQQDLEVGILGLQCHDFLEQVGACDGDSAVTRLRVGETAVRVVDVGQICRVRELFRILRVIGYHHGLFAQVFLLAKRSVFRNRGFVHCGLFGHGG